MIKASLYYYHAISLAGISKLDFTGPELIIVAMISAEKEYVPFTEHIEPLKANGMVEKWLNEVRNRITW